MLLRNSWMEMMQSDFCPRSYFLSTLEPFCWSMSRRPVTILRMITMPGDFLLPDS